MQLKQVVIIIQLTPLFMIHQLKRQNFAHLWKLIIYALMIKKQINA